MDVTGSEDTGLEDDDSQPSLSEDEVFEHGASSDEDERVAKVQLSRNEAVEAMV